MIRWRFTILAGISLVFIGNSPASAQRARFLEALRSVAAAAAPDRPDGAATVREAAGRMRAALTVWDRSIAAMESRVADDGATGTAAFQSHVQLGVAYRTRGRVGDALREFDTALALQPSSSDLQVMRGLALDALGRGDDASRAFDEAWMEDPRNPVKAYYVAERASGEQRARAQAALIGAYGQLAQQDSKDRHQARSEPAHSPFVTLDAIPDDLDSAPIVAGDATADAFSLLRAGRYADAVAALQRAAPAAPATSDSAAAHVGRGHAAEAEGRIGDARREYEAALDGTLAGRALLYVGIARLAQVEGDGAEAVDLFTRASRLQPNDANVHKELALALQPLGRPDDALCEAMAALLIDPSDAQAHAIIGQVYLDTGRPMEALAPLNRALALQPDRYETHYALATALTRMGRTADAAREFQLFERGRVDALDRRRHQIEHDVDREETVRRAPAAETPR